MSDQKPKEPTPEELKEILKNLDFFKNMKAIATLGDGAKPAETKDKHHEDKK